MLQGPSKRYYPNSQLQSEFNYLDDKVHGTLKEYDEKGNLTGKVVALIGYVVEEEENPQKVLEQERLYTLGITLGAIILGALSAFLVSKLKKKLMLLVALLSLFPSVSQAIETLSDEQLKALLSSDAPIKQNEDQTPFTGTVRKKISPGFITIPYQEGFVSGVIRVDYYDGSWLESEILKGKDNGYRREYYPDGTLKLSCEFKDDKCQTSEKRYYETGELQAEKTCIAGQFDGFQRTYYRNGNLDTEFSVKGEVPHGPSKHYSEDGKLISEVTYVAGQKEGLAKTYYPSGALESEATFKRDKLNGPITEYYENGTIYKKYKHKDGIIVGTVKEYYPSGNLYTKAKFQGGHTVDMKFYYDETPAKTIYLRCGLAGYLLAFLLTYGFLRWKRK